MKDITNVFHNSAIEVYQDEHPTDFFTEMFEPPKRKGDQAHLIHGCLIHYWSELDGENYSPLIPLKFVFLRYQSLKARWIDWCILTQRCSWVSISFQKAPAEQQSCDDTMFLARIEAIG